MLFLALQKGQMTIIASPHFPLSKVKIYTVTYIYTTYILQSTCGTKYSRMDQLKFADRLIDRKSVNPLDKCNTFSSCFATISLPL